MINLLPPVTKEDATYARKNNSLLKYCGLMLLVILGIGCLTAAGTWYINNTKNDFTAQVERSKETIKSRRLETVQKQAEEIAGNIKLTTAVLSKEVLFSKLLRQIGSVMPSNSSLSDLKINEGDQAIALTAVATDYNSASQVQVNLADPKNDIFQKADIVGINCDKTDSRYPCTITIRALFGDNTSYLFINPKKAKT